MTETANQTQTAPLFVVSGPSGSGKSTLCKEAVRRTGIDLSVSATTRPQSDKEIEGKDYFFLTRKEFEDKLRRNEFLEHAEVFGNLYGTPAGPVMEKLEAGRPVILEIDVQGALQVFQRFPKAVGILILPPDRDELEKRLNRRGRDDSDTIERRLEKAQWEIEQARQCPNFKHTLINDDLGQAIETLIKLVTK